MPALLFAPRFRAKISSGEKRQTIRGNAVGRGIVPGKIISLRVWKDKPYRSPQVEIRAACCITIERLVMTIDPRSITIRRNGDELNPREVEDFVREDGFESSHDFREHWIKKRCTGFTGTLIRWWPM